MFGEAVVDQLEIVDDCYDIDVLVHNIETTLWDILEVHVLLTTISVTFQHICPWFTSNIKHQKIKNVRWHERIWYKYREDHQWHAYKNEKWKYNNMLKEAKKTIIIEKIVTGI